MPPDLGYLWVPLLGCLVLTGIHAYLGIHVLSRGVIFVDLSLGQIAALGTATALYVGMQPGTTGSYLFSLSFTLLAAAVFSLTRMRKEIVPQEAIIGIVYAVAWSAATLVMAVTEDAHGVEKIRAILIGRSIVWLTTDLVLKTALIYLVIAVFHVVFRRQFLLASFDPAKARAQGMRLGLWDFLFYATFGVVITSSVQIAGVLLVFTFLIVPAVIGALFTTNVRRRLIIGWSCGAAASFLGLLLSYELPSGPVIVVTFGAMLVGASMIWALRHAEQSGVVLRRIALAAGLVGGMVALVQLAPWRSWFAPPQHALAHAAGKTVDLDGLLADTDPLERERALNELRAHPDWPVPDHLLDAVRNEKDPDLETHLAEQGVRRGDRRFLEALVKHVLALKSPFHLEEALHILSRYTDLELGEEDGNVSKDRIRTWWQKNASRLRWVEGKRRFEVR